RRWTSSAWTSRSGSTRRPGRSPAGPRRSTGSPSVTSRPTSAVATNDLVIHRSLSTDQSVVATGRCGVRRVATGQADDGLGDVALALVDQLVPGGRAERVRQAAVQVADRLVLHGRR